MIGDDGNANKDDTFSKSKVRNSLTDKLKLEPVVANIGTGYLRQKSLKQDSKDFVA